MASNQALWRSKLGQNYSKEFMQRNESNLMQELKRLRSLPENRFCADCGDRCTVWASVNLGVFLCLTCGSHHRSLGTHISLPKGCTGTYWWGPDELERMARMGNAVAKQLYGDTLHLTNKPGETDSLRWNAHLVDKYVHKRYAGASCPPSFSPSTGSELQQERTFPQHPPVDTTTTATTCPNAPRKQPSPRIGENNINNIDFFAHFGQ